MSRYRAVGRPTKALAVVFAVFFAAPTLIVIGTAFNETKIIRFPPRGFTWKWFEKVLTDDAWRSAFVTSFQIGVLAALLSMVLGTSLALAAARGRGIPRIVYVSMAVLPMVVPLVAIAVGVYLAYTKVGLYGSVPAFAVAHSVLGTPFVFVNVLAAMRSLDPRIEEAAMVSGATHFQTTLLITLPQIAPAAIIGGFFAFLTSWDEVVVALFLNTPGTRTVPVMIWTQLRSGLDPSVSAASALVTVVSMGVFGLAAVIFFHRSIRRSKPTDTAA